MKKAEKIMVILHVLFSIVGSYLWFRKLMPNVGSENVSWNYLVLGNNLKQDMISRIMCMLIAGILAVALICIFWKVFFKLIKGLRQRNKYAFWGATILIIGVGMILCLYPKMYGVETADDYMNLVYAMEFLPMYWHGFWTNVVYCACMIFFPHPVIIPVVQFCFATYIACYIIHALIKDVSRKKEIAIVMGVVVLALPLFPEILRIFMYPTRNCMYTILCLYGISILFSDYLTKTKLTTAKYVLLSILFAFVGTWRGEGILYLLAFPILIYITYFVEEGNKKLFASLEKIKDKKNVGKAFVLYVFICLLFMLPDKYGIAKYQNSDYMIANTTGPLSAIFLDENANLAYKGADEDLQNIEEIIPLEYIEKYGCNGGFYYNAQSGRFARQSGSTKEEGSAYVNSALRMMIYNLPIWLKYQTNMFIEANQIGTFRFDVNYGKESLDGWRELKPYVRAFELYDCGELFLQEEEVLKLNAELDHKLEERLSDTLNHFYSVVRKKMSWYKMALIAATLVCCVIAWIKKDWLSCILMVINLGVLCAIILMAPWGRANYYYSAFINMLVMIMYFVRLHFSKYLFKS